MSKFILVLFVALNISFVSKAQFFTARKWDYNWDQKAHEKGQIHFSYGYGFPRLDKKLFDFHKSESDFRVIGIGPFFFKTEYGLSRTLSVMVSAAYIHYKSDWTRLRPDPYYTFNRSFTYGTTYQDISANLRFNYHVFVDKQWDVYLGGGAGYNYTTHKDFTEYLPEDTTFKAFFKEPFPVSYEMTAGFRYYFLTRNAIYLEAGLGKSLVQGGFVFKFRHRKRG